MSVPPWFVWLVGCGATQPGTSPGVDRAPPPQATLPTATLPTGLGRAPTPEEIAAWDIDVGPSWQGLPTGRGTAADGERLYTAKCAACHGPDAQGGQGLLGPNLVASEPRGGFGDDWHQPRAIGNWWPYASTLFDYIRRAMPQTAPGSLTADETYALVAFLMFRNGIIGADVVLDQETLKAVQMTTEVHFVRDDRETTSTFR